MESNWELHHVGLIVRDKNKTLDYYQSLGIGLSVGPQPLLSFDFIEVYGRATESRRVHTFFDGECQIGSLLLEVLQPSVARDPNMGFLESKGEGISHICFGVPDIREQTDKLVEKGCQLVFNAEYEGMIFENYVDTSKFGNIWLSMRPPAGKWMKTWMANNMTHYMVSDWKFRGVGVAVRDMDRAVEYYQSLDIATFQPEVVFDSSSSTDFKVHGKTPDTIVTARTRMAQVGPVIYEFIQPLEGETIYKESLDRRGEGITDIAFTVDDLDKETAKLVEKGVPVVLSGKPQTGSAFAYFDTREVGGIMIKLIQAE